MSDPVKPTRPYNSPRRAEQARLTRRRILDAARKLFEAHGYSGTTIAAVAQVAGVSSETVYATFGSKRALVGQLVQEAVRGDRPEPPREQPTGLRVRASRDQREQIHLFAGDITPRLERVGPLIDVVSAAATAEPELAELLETIHRERLGGLRTLVEALAANGALRPGVGVDRGAEIVWTLASPEVHRLLTRMRGWSRARYRAWLEDSLVRMLLPDSETESR